eukprot:COSAG01_NODE_1276_length_10938_cov_76.499862_6_plen_77_part_00
MAGFGARGRLTVTYARVKVRQVIPRYLGPCCHTPKLTSNFYLDDVQASTELQRASYSGPVSTSHKAAAENVHLLEA